MHSLSRFVVAGILVLTQVKWVLGQWSSNGSMLESSPTQVVSGQAPGPLGTPVLPAQPPGRYTAPMGGVIVLEPESGPQDNLNLLTQQLRVLREQQTIQQVAAPDEKVQKQLDLQRQQIETLEKMIRLLADQLKKTPAGGPAVEKLQGQVATLEARSLQGARRDVELGVGAFYPILVNTIFGVRSVEPRLFEAAAMLGCSGPAQFFRVVLPAALPSIFTGMRLGLGFAWVVIVVGEMTGVQTGLGAIIMEARQLSRTEIVISGMIVIGVFGFLSDQLVMLIGRRLLAWSPSHG